jgi:hypothetical protein
MRQCASCHSCSRCYPRIFRIMETAPKSSAPCRGWPASGPGRLPPGGPCLLTGVVRRDSRAKRDVACTFTRHLSPVLVVLRSQSRLRLEGRARTPSGPSPDLGPARSVDTPAKSCGPGAAGLREPGVRGSPVRVSSRRCRMPRREHGGRYEEPRLAVCSGSSVGCEGACHHGPLMTWRTVWTTTPAGAPPGWPVFCSQSRNALKVSSSMDAQLLVQ